MDSGKIKYFIRSGVNFFSPIVCTNCGGKQAIKVDQKYFVTRLFECQQCFLQFRHPVDSKAFSENFYQSEYAQDDGITTDMPSKEKLKEMVDNNFANSPKNVDHVVEMWESIFPNRLAQLKAVDYGCSWGYMSYQFKKKGVEMQSFEISRPRAAFGNSNLGLNIKSNTNELTPGNDLFYSSHVIEHVPSIPEMVAVAKRLLKPDGVFVAECPNGSLPFRKDHESAYHKAWGLAHPSYITDKFYKSLFKKNPYVITSAPYDLELIRKWDGKSQVVGDVSGGQLLVVAKINAE